MHRIFIGTDEAGDFPWHARDDEALPARATNWRLVAETEDPAEAAVVMTLVARSCGRGPAAVDAPEPPPAGTAARRGGQQERRMRGDPARDHDARGPEAQDRGGASAGRPGPDRPRLLSEHRGRTGTPNR
ncbi:MAG TPA: hypothetical protein VMT70_06185 [Vicinamibacteria bacterium]|nr:hypothetical protein [Vicinamibacteria bacterium]